MVVGGMRAVFANKELYHFKDSSRFFAGGQFPKRLWFFLWGGILASEVDLKSEGCSLNVDVCRIVAFFLKVVEKGLVCGFSEIRECWHLPEYFRTYGGKVGVKASKVEYVLFDRSEG